MQTEASRPEPQQLFHGRQVSRLLQNHNSVLTCTDCCSVCGMCYSAVSANWRKGTINRRMFIQKETALTATTPDDVPALSPSLAVGAGSSV